MKFNIVGSSGSRPKGGGGSAFEGLTTNVEFCEDNSGRSKKMRHFRKKWGRGVPSPGSVTDWGWNEG